ncbi:MAG TPA: AAA family ATPase, partial [Oleiagrimonas sp.]|nr:AAA family ATPase [Oleiagrimonas sp.]
MLTMLSVRQFAVVEAVEVEFDAGLTVVTGETGAGKSLLVDALMLLSGARADSGMIRAGCDRAELSASFDLAALPAARDWLAEADLDEDDDTCQLRRVLKNGGKSRAWINGRPATLAQLSALAALLVEIHGQHEHQALLSRA